MLFAFCRCDVRVGQLLWQIHSRTHSVWSAHICFPKKKKIIINIINNKHKKNKTKTKNKIQLVPKAAPHPGDSRQIFSSLSLLFSSLPLFIWREIVWHRHVHLSNSCLCHGCFLCKQPTCPSLCASLSFFLSRERKLDRLHRLPFPSFFFFFFCPPQLAPCG